MIKKILFRTILIRGPLKKIVKKPKIKKKVVEKPKKQSTFFRPPSSSQLKDMLSNLKKVKKNKKLE